MAQRRPRGDLAPHINYEINHKGSVRLAEVAKKAGVRRFIYMSSCSVYGVGTDDFVDETMALIAAHNAHVLGAVRQEMQ